MKLWYGALYHCIIIQVAYSYGFTSVTYFETSFFAVLQEQRKRDERERERVESAKLMETYTRMLDEQERKRQEFINSVSRKQDAMTVRFLCLTTMYTCYIAACFRGVLCLTTVFTCCIAARASGIRCDRNDSSLLYALDLNLHRTSTAIQTGRRPRSFARRNENCNCSKPWR